MGCRTTLIDPVCFLLLKVLSQGLALRRESDGASKRLILAQTNLAILCFLTPLRGKPMCFHPAGHELQQVRHDTGMDPSPGMHWMRSIVHTRRIPAHFFGFSLFPVPVYLAMRRQMSRMEIVLKYFVMTELFICNFVCRCFFWEESHLEPHLQMPL